MIVGAIDRRPHLVDVLPPSSLKVPELPPPRSGIGPMIVASATSGSARSAAMSRSARAWRRLVRERLAPGLQGDGDEVLLVETAVAEHLRPLGVDHRQTVEDDGRSESDLENEQSHLGPVADIARTIGPSCISSSS